MPGLPFSFVFGVTRYLYPNLKTKTRSNKKSKETKIPGLPGFLRAGFMAAFIAGFMTAFFIAAMLEANLSQLQKNMKIQTM